MKLMILAYNPKHVRTEELTLLVEDIKKKHPNLEIQIITHLQDGVEPIYCVNFTDI